MIIIYKGMVSARMFYGRMALFFGGMVSPHIPLNSSTDDRPSAVSLELPLREASHTVDVLQLLPKTKEFFRPNPHLFHFYLHVIELANPPIYQRLRKQQLREEQTCQ